MVRQGSRLLIAGWAALVVVCAMLHPVSATAAERSVEVAGLSVEYRHNPLGIDVTEPRLGWQLSSDERDEKQQAYRILVASSRAKLADGEGDVWDSGKVQSDRSVHVRYAGPALESRTRYYWTVRVWDDDGDTSEWADPAWWEMGLLDDGDWQADWVHRDTAQATPINNTDQSEPAKLKPGSTLGQTFTVDGDFVSVAGRFPTWGSNDSDATMTLRREGPAGEVVASTKLSDHADNQWGSIELDAPQPAGTYYVELSEPSGDIGWWSHRDDTLDGGSAYADGAAAEGDRTLRVDVAPVPEPMMRREFTVHKDVVRARLYATALGVHELRLNGERVGETHLAPGWTDYRERIQYQTYDVTDLVRSGDNAVGALVGAGWYAGHIAIFGPNRYGSTPHLLAQLEITYADGTSQTITTDESWRTAAGPITSSDLLMGETYDARQEQPGWDTAEFDGSGWQPVSAGVTGHNGSLGELVAQNGPTVQATQEIKPVDITEPKPGTYVFDLGQNMVGNVRLQVEGESGQTVRLRHAEVLNDDGTIYTKNLRSARATDHYTLSGDGVEVYEPKFTFHGFRYVEVTGYPGTPDLDSITGRVLRSAAPMTGDLQTSNAMVNQLVDNIKWGQRGNFLSIPTDTPARDERMGWTGDINVFAGAAAYNMQVSPFLSKWLQDLRDAQLDNGAFPDVAPRVGFIGGGAAGWGDAGVTVPWTLWQQYGNTGVIEEQYDAMTRWIDYLVKHSDGYIRPAEGYGDWLNVDDPTPKDLIGTAYFARSASLLADMAQAVGRSADADRFRTLGENVKQAFQDAYIADDGQVKGDSQTGYVLALSFGLVPQQLRDDATRHLVERVEERDGHLSTGFLGTPDLLPVLSDHGELDVAYQLLLQDTYPSWGYQIDRGATTMWEHWDSIKPDGSFENPAMNSFNHYAYGAVGEWMYRNLGGIRSDPQQPGFESMVIRPRPGGGIDHATASYDSVHGEVGTAWRKQDHRFSLDVSVPANTTATVHVPAVNPHAVTESGQPAKDAEGVRFLRMQDGAAVYAVGSGEYHFVSDDVRGHLAAAHEGAGEAKEQAEALVDGGVITGDDAEQLLNYVEDLVGAAGRAHEHYVAGRERATAASAAVALAHSSRLHGLLSGYREPSGDGDVGALLQRLRAVDDALSAASVDLHGAAASLTLPSSPLLPGSTVRAKAEIKNGDGQTLHDPELRLDLPDGWTAQPVGDPDDVVGAGETVTLPIDVSVPADEAVTDDRSIAGVVSYRHGASRTSVPVEAITDVVSPVQIVGVEAQPRILEGPGEKSRVSVTVRNRSESPLSGTVDVAAPEGWTVSPASTPYQLAGAGETTVTADVTSPPGEEAPAADIDVVARYGDLDGETASVRVTSALAEWAFNRDGDAEGWQPHNQLSDFVVADGFLETTALGGDPFMVYGGSLSLDASEGATVEITMESSASSDAQVFWGTAAEPFFSEGKSTKFTVDEGGPRTYSVEVPPQHSRLTMLRVDPLTVEGDVRIDSIKVLR